MYAANVTPVSAATVNEVLGHTVTQTPGIKVSSPTSAHPFFGV